MAGGGGIYINFEILFATPPSTCPFAEIKIETLFVYEELYNIVKQIWMMAGITGNENGQFRPHDF